MGKVAQGPKGPIDGMSLFSRYIFRQAFGALTMILLSLTAVVWIAMALKQLSLVTSGGAGGVLFIELTGLILPDIMSIIAPIAMLIAALYTLNKLNQDSELIVMTAAGATVWRFARPLFALAMFVAAWLLFANLFLNPWSQQKINDLANQLKSDLITQVLQPGAFSSPEEGLTFHIRERDGAGRFQGLVISDARSATEQLTYIANSGEVLKRAEKAYLILHDGKVLRKSPNQDASIIEFESYVLDLATASEKGKLQGPKPHAMYVSELWTPDPNDSNFQSNPGSFRAELHERFVGLLYPFAFVAIVVAFLGQARTNRQGRSQAQVAAFSLSAGLKMAGIAAFNMFASKPAAGVLVYGLPIGAIALSLVMMRRGLSSNRNLAAQRWVQSLAEPVAGLALRLVKPVAALRRGGAG